MNYSNMYSLSAIHRHLKWRKRSIIAALVLFAIVYVIGPVLIEKRHLRKVQVPMNELNRVNSVAVNTINNHAPSQTAHNYNISVGTAITTPSRLRISQRKRKKRHDCEQRLPKALVVGFQKCGTGTFMRFLNLHPDISAVLGETAYFSVNYARGLYWYKSQMTCSDTNQITIEKTPGYAININAAARIYEMDKNMKIFFIIRDPVWRVVSHWSHVMRDEHQNTSKRLSDLIIANGTIVRSQYIVSNSRYYKHINRFLKIFQSDQIHIADGENFVLNPAEELQKAEKFLNLRPFIRPEHFVYNEEKGYFCRNRTDDIKCMGPAKGVKQHETVPRDVLEQLFNFFKPDNERLFELLGRRYNWTFGKPID